jgi:hypothetical protein
MPRSRKYDIAKIRAEIDVECPTCFYKAGPADLKRPGGKWSEVLCPKCGAAFEIPQKGGKPCSRS